MRTTSTKTLETMTFSKLSTWSILIGAFKEVWSRHSDIFWITGFWVQFALLVWYKLGK